MPETSSAQHPAGAAASEKNERLRLKLATGGILLALAIVVTVLRFHRLDELPPGLANDEGLEGWLALRVLQGEHAVFFPVSKGRAASNIYALAFSTALFGRTLWAMHLPTALGSAGMVFALFSLGRVLFGRDRSGRSAPWQGLFIGGVGAGLLAVSLGQTVTGRNSFNNVPHMTLLICLVSDAALEGVANDSKPAQSLADSVGRGLRRFAALYLYSGAFCFFTVSLVWIELSPAFWFRHRRGKTNQPAETGACREQVCSWARRQ